MKQVNSFLHKIILTCSTSLHVIGVYAPLNTYDMSFGSFRFTSEDLGILANINQNNEYKVTISKIILLYQYMHTATQPMILFLSPFINFCINPIKKKQSPLPPNEINQISYMLYNLHKSSILIWHKMIKMPIHNWNIRNCENPPKCGMW